MVKVEGSDFPLVLSPECEQGSLVPPVSWHMLMFWAFSLLGKGPLTKYLESNVIARLVEETSVMVLTHCVLCSIPATRLCSLQGCLPPFQRPSVFSTGHIRRLGHIDVR